MDIYDYNPFIYFKDDPVSHKAKPKYKFLTMHEAIESLGEDILHDRGMGIMKRSGFIPASLKITPLKDITMVAICKGFSFYFQLVCKITDLEMYQRYANYQLTDSLYKKCFTNRVWPFMKPVLIYCSHDISEFKSLNIMAWATENQVKYMVIDGSRAMYFKELISNIEV